MAKKRPTTDRAAPADPGGKPAAPRKLLADLRELIESTRAGVAQAVNSALVILYWQVGHRIRSDVLHNRRADYGEKILPTLSAKLVRLRRSFPPVQHPHGRSLSCWPTPFLG